VRDRQNEVDFVPGSEDDFDVNNSTYTTKVLEDGRVLHINRTTIADSSDDGTSFFLHKTIFSSAVGEGEEEQQDEEDLEAGVDDGLTK